MTKTSNIKQLAEALLNSVSSFMKIKITDIKPKEEGKFVQYGEAELLLHGLAVFQTIRFKICSTKTGGFYVDLRDKPYTKYNHQTGKQEPVINERTGKPTYYCSMRYSYVSENMLKMMIEDALRLYLIPENPNTSSPVMSENFCEGTEKETNNNDK